MSQLEQREISAQIANEWDSSGKSVFLSSYFAEQSGITVKHIYELDAQVRKSLITNGEAEPKTTYSYSGCSEVSVQNKDIQMEVTAIGVGENFFYFHPVSLLSGSYFYPEQQGLDLVIIDQNLAWVLYGSDNIVGMSIEIGGKPHRIAGVMKWEKSGLQKRAGYNKPLIFMSYPSLKGMDETLSVTACDVLMSEITSGFGKTTLKSYLETNMGLRENQYDIVNHTKRLKKSSLKSALEQMKYNSMKTKQLSYPYWENMSRYVRDECARLLCVQMVAERITVLILLWKVMQLWRTGKFERIKFSNICKQVWRWKERVRTGVVNKKQNTPDENQAA